jgi:hypothetical protein
VKQPHRTVAQAAGEIEEGDDAIPAEDYDAAWNWVSEQIAWREGRR